MLRLGARLARPFSSARIARFPGEISIKKDESDASDVAKLSQQPEELTRRIVRIYKEAPPATQSGRHHQVDWKIDWDIESRAYRWEDHTIGYESSGDYMQATQVKFREKEDAIRFATNQGWDYFVQEPRYRRFKPKSYADNFLHSPGKLKNIMTK